MTKFSKIKIFLSGLVLTHSAAVWANPNQTTADVQVEPQSETPRADKLVAGIVYRDNFGNQYLAQPGPFGTITGSFRTEGCSTSQTLNGKKIGRDWLILVNATAAGDCIGGILYLEPAEDDGLTGRWRSPITGGYTDLELVPE